jgi:pilus assembly protein FimV
MSLMHFYSSLVKPRFQLVMMLPAMILAAGDCFALGLGELSMHSHLGARFHAEVRLVESAGDQQPSESCFRLSRDEESDSGIPTLVSGYFSIERKNGQSRLIITSNQTINDPVLQIKIRAGCGAEIVRSYTVLVDPVIADEPARRMAISLPKAPDYQSEQKRSTLGSASPPVASASPLTYPEVWQTVEGESAQSIAKALFERQPKAQRRFLMVLLAENPDVDLGVRGEKPLDSGTTLNIPDTRHLLERPKLVSAEQSSTSVEKPTPPSGTADRKKSSERKLAGRMADHLTISGNTDEEFHSSDVSLRLSPDLSTHLSDKISENARALLRVEYRLLNSLYVQVEQQLAVAEQIRDLEANFEALRIAAENVERRMPPAVTANVSDTRAVAPAATAPVKASASAVLETVKPKREESSIWWLEILIILGLTGTLTWLLFRNAGRHKPEASSTEDETPIHSNESSLSRVEQPMHGLPASLEASGAAADIPIGEATAPLPLATANDKHDLQVQHIEMDAAGDCNTVMELAEIMVSFGRIKGATQALEEFLESDPGAALNPWLKLLEIYQANNMREEFEACSAKLNSHFNVSPVAWESAAESLKVSIAITDENDLSIEALLQRLPTIMTIPRLKESIQNAWGTPEALDYLKSLLSDTRNGSRNGFPLAIAHELLFLIDLRETRPQRKR